ncbi:hypothetical protein ACFL03_14110 [Thermodesulfobacteriota bacterium]
MRINNRLHISFRVFLIFFLGILISASFNTLPCWGSEKALEPAVISLDVKNMPLKKVCDQILNATGYEIIFNKKWINEPITIKLNNVALTEGLKRIIQKLGIKNHAIVAEEVNHTLQIYTFDGQLLAQVRQDYSIRGVQNNGGNIDPDEMIVTPPSVSGQGLTRGELEALLEANKSRTLSEDDIITPLSASGKGLTRGELKALIESNKQKTLSKDDIVTPPSASGRGLTRAELEALMEADRQRGISADEIVTPSAPGSPGLNRGELVALLEANRQRQQNLSKDTVITPPTTNGGRGLTLGELEAIKETSKQKALSKDTVITPPTTNGGARIDFW